LFLVEVVVVREERLLERTNGGRSGRSSEDTDTAVLVKGIQKKYEERLVGCPERLAKRTN
jgi:hypothetical protein